MALLLRKCKECRNKIKTEINFTDTSSMAVILLHRHSLEISASGSKTACPHIPKVR